MLIRVRCLIKLENADHPVTGNIPPHENCGKWLSRLENDNVHRKLLFCCVVARVRYRACARRCLATERAPRRKHCTAKVAFCTRALVPSWKPSLFVELLPRSSEIQHRDLTTRYLVFSLEGEIERGKKHGGQDCAGGGRKRLSLLHDN